MENKNFTITILVDKTPKEVFDAINNVREWWSENITGKTDKVGEVWEYRYKDMHSSKQKIIELIPGKKIVWKVLESYLSFIENKKEWDNTEIIFDIKKKGDKTELRFTHVGLTPKIECYGACSDAWSFYIKNSLYKFINNGKGKQNKKEKIQEY